MGGARVLNGSRAFSLELSKSAQAALLGRLGIDHPRSLAFNDAETAVENWTAGWPALLKPEQGGSGARMFLLNSGGELLRLLRDQPALWEPDHLLLLQEYFPVDAARGIVRMEFLGGKLLYAMRVVSHGAFNLCPSEACNPEGGGESHCAIPEKTPPKPVEFYPFKEAPGEAVEAGERIRQRADWTWAGSNTWRRLTGGGCSMTSTRTRICGLRSGRRSDSIRLTGWWNGW